MVDFGRNRAEGLRIDDSKSIVVLVPQVEEGRVTITVRDRGGLVGSTDVTIVPPPLRRLLLVYDQGEIELEGSFPYNGTYDRVPASGLRLAYDVVDEGGQLIHSGAVGHPSTARREIFDQRTEGGIHGEAAGGPIHFIIKIPNTKGRLTLRLFDAGPGLNLADPTDRADRKPISEIHLP